MCSVPYGWIHAHTLTPVAQRPDVKELLKHKFISKAKKTSSLVDWISKYRKYMETRNPNDDSDDSSDEEECVVVAHVPARRLTPVFVCLQTHSRVGRPWLGLWHHQGGAGSLGSCRVEQSHPEDPSGDDPKQPG